MASQESLGFGGALGDIASRGGDISGYMSGFGEFAGDFDAERRSIAAAQARAEAEKAVQQAEAASLLAGIKSHFGLGRQDPEGSVAANLNTIGYNPDLISQIAELVSGSPLTTSPTPAPAPISPEITVGVDRTRTGPPGFHPSPSSGHATDVIPGPRFDDAEVVDPLYEAIAAQMYPKDRMGNFDIDKAKELGLGYSNIVAPKNVIDPLTSKLTSGPSVTTGAVTQKPSPGLGSIASDLFTPILVHAFNALDKSRRTASSPSRSDLVSDIPAQMPGYISGNQEPPPMYEDNESGNVAAIRRFLQDPTYGNIPQVDPVSALTAYENAIGGIDALVGERGFTGQGYAQAARDRAQGIFDEFLPGQDVDALLNEKIGRAFAEEALTAKGSEFRQQGVQSIEQSFPEGFAGEIFSPEAFSKAAENIYGEKLQGAQDIIARAGARGQLSPRGGRLASESLLSQGPDVRGGISDIVSGVRSGLEGGLQGIRGSALEQAQGYQLGDELFDVTPFEQQASDYVTGAFGDIPSDISGAIGTDPLFDAVSALQTGGRQQGQVSGTPSFLDVLAEREGGVGTGRDRRGLGSRGSGVF